MSNVLTKIIETKAAHIVALQRRYPDSSLSPKLSDRPLYDSLRQDPAGFILECKKASPSKGLIREDFHLETIADTYGVYANGISVLTDEEWFQGDIDYLPRVRNRVKQPVLCKDFFIETYQVRLAAHMGADAILLMLSVLSDDKYRLLAREAEKYQLDILTEVSNQQELERALRLDAKIIGINNRNLRDLSTDLTVTEVLAPQIPADRVIISESGIYTHHDVRRLAPMVQGFLVGSSLMAQKDLDQACRALIFGENKVCGLTRGTDLLAAATAGALYGGLIFARQSPRCISDEQARQLAEINAQSRQKLQLVGVFVNSPIDRMVNLARDCQLNVIQLHGLETSEQIESLKQALRQADLKCQIWKAIAIESQTGQSGDLTKGADRYLYDTRHGEFFGGSGETFNWQLPLVDKGRAMLAGGLNAENARAAARAGFAGLDFNSGLEQAPGIKDKDKIKQTFAQLRHY